MTRDARQSTHDLRRRILLAIGASGVAAVACGSGASTPSKGPTDAASSDGALATEGGAGEAGDAATADAATGADATTDAPTSDASIDALADADGSACAPSGAACTQTSECCPPGVCNAQQCFVSVRRPFLVGSSLRKAEAIERSDWAMDPDASAAPAALDPVTAAALARDWLSDGCEEHASIAAFARFTMHLLSVGAPPAMIVESQRASLDEVNHARACFALARRYGGRSMGPAELPLDGAMPPMTLVDIAALTAEEGCVGETLGVLLAEEQLARTTDPRVRALLVSANIVDDERRHAELAWAFVSWAVACGGEPVKRAVRAAIGRAVAATLATPIRSYDGVDPVAWRAHGRLSCADARAVAERGVRELVEPCAAALLGAPALALAPPEQSLGA